MVKANLQCAYTGFSPHEIDLAPVNFIFGKNGTGKSTIAKLLKDQFSQRYNVQSFAGFSEYIANNDSLNAIALGKSNATIQRQIDALNEKIQKLSNELDENYATDNCAARLAQAQKEVNDKKKNLEDLFSKCARDLKNMSRPQIASPTYNKRNFEDEIKYAQKLGDTEIANAKQECQATKMPAPQTVTYPDIDIQELTKTVNELLTASISATIKLPEIGDNPAKQAFAKKGMEVHDRSSDTRCAFCGGELTPSRWKSLDALFNDAAKQFQEKLDKALTDIDEHKSQLSNLPQLTPEEYYSRFQSDVSELNNQILRAKDAVGTYLSDVRKQLMQRKQQLFITLPAIQEPQLDWNAKAFQADLDNILRENNQYGQTLEDQQQNARDRLRYHHIDVLLHEAKYADMKAELSAARKALKCEEDEQTEIKTELKKLRNDKEMLIYQTSSEEIAVNHINRMLQSLGNSSFELRLSPSADGVKGQYKIYSADKERDINTLSTGERNLVAFLYFMQTLEKHKEDARLMVIMDDPMNSNDEASQYVMYSYIQRFYRNPKNKNGIQPQQTAFTDANQRIFVLLTHNAHFFLNARPYMWDPEKNKKQRCFTLRKVNNATEIHQIQTKADDIQTGYNALWQELRFAYDNDRPSAMWNPLRRIIDSFADFNAVDTLDDMITNDSLSKPDCTIAAEIKKSADVNSHGLFEISINTNNHTREQIMDFAKWYFKNADGEKHFERFWNTSPNN